MESVRARIFFSESLSGQATTQVKCMILVPRSEFPYISSLKEHIRKKFSISDGARLELSIDGFVIPDWEKSEVIRENDVICVHALQASAHSHAFLEERSHKKKKRKRSREAVNLNCDNDSGMHKATQVVHDVQDGIQVKKKKKLHESSKRRNENESTTSNEVEDKLKTKHKKKDEQEAKERMKRRKKDSDQHESLPEVRQMMTLERDCSDENNQTKFSGKCTNDIVADGSELQASLSTAKEVADFYNVHNKANGEDMSVNGSSAADKSIELNSGVGEASDKGSTQKKRRRRRRKRKSNVITTENSDLLGSTRNDKVSKPNSSVTRNGLLESDQVKNSARIINQVQNKSTMPKDETVAIATSGGHIVFESESDGENDPLKLHPSESLLETMQSKEVTTKDTPCATENVLTPPAQQHKETEVESEMKGVRNEDEEAASFDCLTPPGAGDGVTGGNKVVETRDYAAYPPLNGPPRNGDIIAFKMLELTADYCPEVSEYKEGVVTEFNPSTQYVGIQLTKGPTSKELSIMSEGRFEMELDDEWTTDRNQQKSASLLNVLLTSMIEPKLLSV